MISRSVSIFDQSHNIRRSIAARLGCFAVSILLFGLFLNVSAMAQSAGITAGSATGLPGAAVEIPVRFTPGATGVSALQFDVSFPSALEATAVTIGPAATLSGKEVAASHINGGIRILAFGLNQNQISSGTIANVQLTISAGAAVGSLPISVGNVVASDANANAVSVSIAGGSVTVVVPSDTTPPVISGLSITNLTDTSAVISWSTNENSNSQVDYGTTTSYTGVVLDSSVTKSHAQTITGLTASTLYHYRVKSSDTAGNLATSGDYMFTTQATPDTTPPTISAVSSASVTDKGVTISWTTNEAADTQVEYGTTAGYGSSTTLNSAKSTSHSQALSGLTASTLYHYRVKSSDAAGNLATSEDNTFTTAGPADTTPPTISDVSSINITATDATITWITNEDADTQVEYGKTAGYGSSTSLNSSKVKSHAQTLSGLTAGTLYHYRVKSKDAVGNLSVSGDYTLITDAGGAYEFAMPFFSGIQNTLGENTMVGIDLTNNGSRSATVTFTAMNNDGAFILGPDIVNPVSKELGALAQIPELDYQVFGEGMARSASDGWISINGTSTDTRGYFLVFDSERTFMDGANFAGAPVTDFIFTDIQPQGYNKISVINDNSSNADVAFELMSAEGTILSSASRAIAGKGAFTADLSELFAGMTPASAEYVRARANQSVSSFHFMRQNSGDIAILEGQSPASGSSTIYAPHYAYGDLVRTTLSVVNLDSGTGSVMVRLIGNDGALLGQEKVASIQGYGKLFIEDPQFFGLPKSGDAVQGYVEIVSNGIRISGSALYSDINRQTFASALTLVSNLQTSMLFNHVISNDSYSSQIVMMNPGATDAVVTGALYSPDGTLVATKQQTLKAKTQQMLDMTEFFPTLAGAKQEKGYVRILSDNPVAAFMQFSTKNLSAMAVIPPQFVPPTVSVQNELKKQKIETAKSYFNSILKSFLSRGK